MMEQGDCPPPDALKDAAKTDVHVLRILDAAANRAREGLRVVEDYVRFALDDRHLTEQCKRLRHELAAALGRLPLGFFLAARETQADVGTTLTTPSEQHRPDAQGVLAASFSRLEESLRTLEEFGKLLDAGMASSLEQLRYRAYTLQRAVELTRAGLARLADARLCVLLDGGSSAEELKRLARGLIAAGADVLQLRDKRLADGRLLERARLLREMTAGTPTLLIVNDRPDVARLARADGVHLGQDDLSVKDARAILGPEALIGVSTHSIQQARQAVLDGASYIGTGPTFPSSTKQFEEFPGVALLRAVAAEIRLPAFAIGGIHPSNLAEVLAAGVRRVAVSGAVATAADPAAVVREMSARLRGA
jgi:thiamine-phosphate pyrophosphorylase